MQYFTFLGMGSFYKEVIYSFQDNKDHIYCTQYIQEAIIKEFIDEINEIYVFCTDKSYEDNGEVLFEKIKNECDKEINFIKVDNDVQTEEIVLQMNKVLSEDFIIDVTHSFRNIPISVTLITRYLEYSSGYHLKHLYYGNLNSEKEEGLIIDLIQQYQHSQLVNEIESFDKYLKVSNRGLMIYEQEKKINMLLQSFDNFNHMLEYCEFDKSIGCIREIVEYSRGIIKDAKYILIHPYLYRIIDKFKNVVSCHDNASKKIYLIKILLNHHHYQVAITFTDQLLREEIIHYSYFPNYLNFNECQIKDLSTHKDVTVYQLSQDLLFYLNIRNSADIRTKPEVLKIREKYMDLKKNINLLDKKSINDFYLQIRNNINHGNKINDNVDVELIINKCLESLEAFIKEG